jgi:Tfp pilus assembly protein PilN
MVSFGRKGQTAVDEVTEAESPAPAPAPVATPVAAPLAAFPRVNLIPAEIAQEARVRRSKVVLAGAVAASVAAIAGLYVMASADVSSAQESLDASRATSASLASEQAKYADVPRVQSDLLSAQTQQALAMGGEVRWSTVLNNLALTVPPGVSLGSFQGTITGSGASTGAASTPGSPAVSSMLGQPGVGSFLFEGQALDSARVSALLEALTKSGNLLDPFVTQLTADTSGSTGAATTNVGSSAPVTTKPKSVNFTGSVTIGPKSLSHRYDVKGN